MRCSFFFVFEVYNYVLFIALFIVFSLIIFLFIEFLGFFLHYYFVFRVNSMIGSMVPFLKALLLLFGFPVDVFILCGIEFVALVVLLASKKVFIL